MKGAHSGLEDISGFGTGRGTWAEVGSLLGRKDRARLGGRAGLVGGRAKAGTGLWRSRLGNRAGG